MHRVNFIVVLGLFLVQINAHMQLNTVNTCTHTRQQCLPSGLNVQQNLIAGTEVSISHAHTHKNHPVSSLSPVISNMLRSSLSPTESTLQPILHHVSLSTSALRFKRSSIWSEFFISCMFCTQATGSRGRGAEATPANPRPVTTALRPLIGIQPSIMAHGM